MIFKEFKVIHIFLKKYRWAYVFGVFFLIITNAAQVISPQFMKKAINALEKKNIDLNYILIQVLYILLAALVMCLGRFLWRQFILGSAYRIAQKLRQKLFLHLMTLSENFFSKNRAGDLLARATHDTEKVYYCLGWGVIGIMDGLFLFTSILVVLLYNYGLGVFWFLIPLPLIAILLGITSPIMSRLFSSVQKSFGDLSHSTQETLAGAYLLKAYHAETSALDRFTQINDQYIANNLKLSKIQGAVWPFVGFVAGLTIVFLLYFGGKRVISGVYTAGDFIALLSYLVMLIWPLVSIGFTYNMFQRGAASLKRINAVLAEKEEIIDKGTLRLPGNNWSQLEWSNISFAYEQKVSFVLEDINLCLKKGQTLGIIGRIGSGKTSLIQLLPRLLNPTKGELRLDNEPFQAYDLNFLRELFAVVPQNSFLFSDTIRNNIAFGKPEASDEEIDEVVEMAGILKDLSQFPLGLETVVGEKGVTLSGGQKQRLAIARALLMNAPILILDDSLSACDSETSERILKNLKTYRSTLTNIYISHRIDVIRDADIIIVLDEGKIVQQGIHSSLIQEEGFYQDMYKIQG